MVTGLLGAGGGFLLIPVLKFLIKLPIKKAIVTKVTKQSTLNAQFCTLYI
ncbi:hypothetical protein [Daejeonella sp.]